MNSDLPTESTDASVAALEFREDTDIDPEVASRLAREAVALDRELGDPRLAAKKSS